MTKRSAKNGAQCTVRLLSIAAQAAYRVRKDNLIDPTTKPEYAQTLTDIAEHGYAITKSIAPKGAKGTGTTPLAAVCLEPQDPTAPIVISFRGTKTAADFAADLELGATGVVSKKFRDAAYKFYAEVRRKNPGREIILTGHSLGGHLAQYVATKAYNTDSMLFKKPLVQVRTFNTGPIDTVHSAVFQRKPELRSYFVNYRLTNDVVSDLPIKNYYGNTFVFPYDKSAFKSHSMGPVTKALPEDILDQYVGTSANASNKQNRLIELTNGLLHSYQCRVDDQYFSRFRAGAKNLEAMKEVLPEALEDIKNGDYDEAISKLKALREELDGIMSTHMVNVLIRSTMNVKRTHQMEEVTRFKDEAAAVPVVEETSPVAKIKAELEALKKAPDAEIESEQEARITI